MPETWGEGLALFLLLSGVLGVVWHFANVHVKTLRTGKLVEQELTPNDGKSLVDKTALLLVAYSNLESQVEDNTKKLEHIDECLDDVRKGNQDRIDRIEHEQAEVWRHLAEHGAGRREGDL